MKHQKTSPTALRLAPDVKGLYVEARILRDTVLNRIIAAGFEIDEELLPEAEAIVSSHIGALVAAPDTAYGAGRRCRAGRFITRSIL